MNKLIPLVTLIFMLSVTSTTAFAGKIYKWVDKKGEVHYSEHPPSGKSEQMFVPHSTTTRSAPAPKATNKTDAANKFLDAMDKENKEKKEAADKAAKKKAIRDKNCSIAKKRVAALKIGGRKFEVDEKGNRHYLDNSEIQSQLNEAQADVAKYCQ
jgi:hypothetical protein